jgi:hypothetical protein
MHARHEDTINQQPTRTSLEPPHPHPALSQSAEVCVHVPGRLAGYGCIPPGYSHTAEFTFRTSDASTPHAQQA